MMPARKVRRSARPRRVSSLQILAVVGVAVVAVALLVVLNLGRQGSGPARSAVYPTGLTADGQPYKGSPEAPVEIVEFSDFLCPHCADLAHAFDALAADYIETGKVRIVFRNFAFLTPESVQAAQAAECALQQGADKFWRYHDELFARTGAGRSAFSNAQLKAMAQQIALDRSAFDQCLDSGARAGEVEADKAYGQGLGVRATPTWFINGQEMPGALPEAELRQVIEEALKGVEKK